MSSWHSYSSMYNLGHRVVQDIFKSIVSIEEKIDGSQFNFGIIEGELKIKSKGALIDINNPEKMFKLAVDEVLKRKDNLVPGWTYRGEYLKTEKHNVLKYNRIPDSHVIIFDIATAQETYLDYKKKVFECERIGFEVVPLLYEGVVLDAEQLKHLLEKESILGGVKIEGFVVKNYEMYNPEKKILIAKYVSESFKETHKVDWKVSNPGATEFIERLAQTYRTDARWNKAIQHLRDNGLLTDSPKDIGNLIKEIKEDILKEYEAEIKQTMFDHFWLNMSRIVVSRFPEYYKNYLMEKQFQGEANGK